MYAFDAYSPYYYGNEVSRSAFYPLPKGPKETLCKDLVLTPEGLMEALQDKPIKAGCGCGNPVLYLWSTLRVKAYVKLNDRRY